MFQIKTSINRNLLFFLIAFAVFISFSRISAETSQIKMYMIKFYSIDSTYDLISDMFKPAKMYKDKVRQLLIISDSPSKHEEISAFLETYDTEPKVILVEGTILKINKERLFELGINGSKSAIRSDYNPASALTNQNKPEGTIRGQYGHDWFTLGAVPQLFFEIVTNHGNLWQIDLRSMIEKGAAEVVLKPQVTFVSGSKGIINHQTNVPYQTETKMGGATTTFQKYGLSLEVQGYYIPDKDPMAHGSIYVNKLKITDGSIVGYIQFANATVPLTQDLEIETSQIVKDGELIILGGAINKENSKTVRKVPLLGDIPVIKHLFRFTEKNNKVTETLALLRLTVIEEKSYEFLAAKYQNSKNLQPIEFGGDVNESVHEHPLNSAKWSSDIIYGEGLYFERIYNRFSEDEQYRISRQFKTRIRARLPLVQEWEDVGLIRDLIFNDSGLESIFKEISDEFDIDALDILIVARHQGGINDIIFEIYRDFLRDRHMAKHEE